MGPPTSYKSQHQPHSNIGTIDYGLGLHLEHPDHQTQRGVGRQGPRTSAERLLHASHTESDSGRPGQDRQFSLLRDSLVFNHERLLQHSSPQSQSREHYTIDENQADSVTTHYNPSPHYTSLTTFGVTSTTELEESGRHPMPKLYSVPNEPPHSGHNQDQLDDNYNGSPTRSNHPSYLRNSMARRNAPIQNEDIQDALERANLIGRDGTASGQDTDEIPLTGTKASLHLPTPPASPPMFYEGDDLPPKQPSVTTVTTVYSYKCERHPNHAHHENDEHDKQGLPLPTLRHGEYVPPPGSKTRQDCEMTMIHDYDPSEFQGQPEDGNIIPMEVDPNNPNNDQEHRELLLPADNENEVENKRNDTRVITNGDYATDDDGDEDITIHTGQSQPIFPNPADLKWPEPSYLRISLPQKYHQFLAPGYKKDCRVWLWKNRKGRKAREMLGLSSPTPRMITPSSSNSSLKNHRTGITHSSPHGHVHGHGRDHDSPNRRAFADNREMDIAEEVDPNQQQQPQQQQPIVRKH